MKIAMIGSGAAGSVFAGYLRRGGADITLVDPYKEHMDKIAKDGLTFVIYPDQEYQVTGYKTAVLAYCFGDGFSDMFWPTACTLNCGLMGVPLNKWYKFMTPLFFIMVALQVFFIALSVVIYQ